MMPLQCKGNSPDEIPAPLQSLHVEGAADKAKLDEVRGNNIALATQLWDLKQGCDGIDPVEVRKLEEVVQLKAGEYDKVIDTRHKSVRADFDMSASGGREDSRFRLVVGDPEGAVHLEPFFTGLAEADVPLEFPGAQVFVPQDLVHLQAEESPERRVYVVGWQFLGRWGSEAGRGSGEDRVRTESASNSQF